jgi:hypothetical protein
MRWICLTIRGCRSLPHVGSHPGTGIVFLTLLAGAAAGVARGGLSGAVGGAALVAAFVVPLYLVGAHDRAHLSDRLTEIRGRSSAEKEESA